MLQKNLIYIILWLLIQLLVVEINCQLKPFKPKKRFLHTVTLIDNKLYILGGETLSDAVSIGKDFFILMFLSHLTLKIYYGMIYQKLILFQHILVLRL
jgi:hypothetical protein